MLDFADVGVMRLECRPGVIAPWLASRGLVVERQSTWGMEYLLTSRLFHPHLCAQQ